MRLATLLTWLLFAISGAANTRGAADGAAALTLTVDASRAQGEWRIPLTVLDAALGLDANEDDTIEWSEISSRRGQIEGHLSSHAAMLANGAVPGLRFDELLYGAQGEVPSLLSRFTLTAPEEIERLTIDVTLLLVQAREHRTQLKVVWPGHGSHVTTLTAAAPLAHLTRDTARSKSFFDSVKSGIWHIWIGYDHVLFLLVLLVPAVFQRTAHGREAVRDFRAAFTRVLIIVSSFTVAHSITLTCAALQWIVLPSRLVESAIAISVVIAAIVNLLPRTAGVTGAWVAFAFGLLHGFGFANVLSEVDAEGAPLARTLVGFNLGVEIGQLAIVATFLPLAYLLRETTFYRRGVLYGGSSAAAVCALFWFWQRAM